MKKMDVGDWTEFRKLPGVREVDFHPDPNDDITMRLPYWEEMENVAKRALAALKDAYESGDQYVLFTHGWSTSHMGKTTSRSQVRKTMMSKEATPYIDRRRSIQHYSVFLAAVRRRPAATPATS
jgi:hypothetical protein